MTRTSHKAHATPAFPVYCLDWTDDDTVVLGGGGGASRSGIENKIKLAKVSKDARELKYLHELKLGSDEDAPMTLAVDRVGKRIATGVNASREVIERGENKHLRVFDYAEDKITPRASAGTIRAPYSDEYPYQRHTSISPRADFIAISTTDNVVGVFSFPDLEPGQVIEMKDEVVDLQWGGLDGRSLLIATTTALAHYRQPDPAKGVLELQQVIYAPSLDIAPVTFRAARIHAVLNSQPAPRRGGSKGGRGAAPARKGWVVTFGMVAGPSHAGVTPAEAASGVEKEAGVDEDEKAGEGTTSKSEGEAAAGDELPGRWDVLGRREVGAKPVTVFDTSADGKLLAYGCSDMSIGILDAVTLNPLLKILHAHSFPPTALRFNPSATLLVSASADNTIRAIVVPAHFGSGSTATLALIVAVLVLLLALLMMRR